LADPIHFYFDFSSPFGYMASEQIDALAAKHGRSVVWKPLLLGAIFKETGGVPIVDVPMKGAYARRDVARTARYHQLPLVMPPDFPFPSIAAARAGYWAWSQSAEQGKALMQGLLRAAWQDGTSIASPEAVIAVAAKLGHEPETVKAALQDQAVKDRLRDEIEEAKAKQVFGSPFFIVDEEPFWGQDRIEMLDAWMTRGGW